MMTLGAVAVAALAVAAVHAVGGRYATGAVRVAAEVTAIASMALLVAFVAAYVSSAGDDWSDPCGERAGEVGFRVEWQLVPMKSECIRDDGVRVDRTPGWANPTLAALAVVAASGGVAFLAASALEPRSGRPSTDRPAARR